MSVETLLKGWVERGEIPEDFYALLGRPRFHRNREELLEGVRAGYRFLQGYQCDVARRKIAAQLQRQLASARQVFDDDAAWKDYDEALTTRASRESTASAALETVVIDPAPAVPAARAQRQSPESALNAAPPPKPAVPKARSHPVLPALPRSNPPPVGVAPRPGPPPVTGGTQAGLPVTWLIVGVLAVTAVVFGTIVALAAIGWALMSSPRPLRTTWKPESVAVMNA